jgi:hypothetical protein
MQAVKMERRRGSALVARHDPLLKGDDTMPDQGSAERDLRTRATSGNEGDASTLLPMLVAGLVLIVVGAVVVMTFV